MARKRERMPVLVDDYPRLSLLAQFDDIVRCSQQLSLGIENEFTAFAYAERGNHKKWNEAVKEIERLKSEVLKYKHERDAFGTKWKHMISLMETEMQKRQKIEREKKSLERQIALIKDVLLSDQNVCGALNDQTKEKLAFLNTDLQHYGQDANERRLDTIEESLGSLLSSDVSFDKTDEDIDNFEVYSKNTIKSHRSKSKRSFREHKEIPGKKPKLVLGKEDDSPSHQEIFDDNQGISDNSDDVGISQHRTSGPCTLSKRCFSEPVPSSGQISAVKTCKSDNTPCDEDQLNIMYIRSDSAHTPIRRFSSSGKISRAHVFCTKTVIRPETCNPCGHRIRFYKQALKCQECRITCHPECKELAPLPCYPTMQTPTYKGAQGTIKDYAPSSTPMIPSLIIHCVNEIEARGLDEVGLYRVSGSEREVKELKEKFLKGKCTPSLNKTDVHAICGTIKEFLRSLNEPLITRNLWRVFVNVSEMQPGDDQFNAICQSVSLLPQPNRDTLAFLLLHLAKVAESPQCKMPIENLAKVFGPTVVGYSLAEPSESDTLSEIKHQYAVMEMLLKMPTDYWETFLSSHVGVISCSGITPEARPAPAGNRLGPLSSSGSGATSHKQHGVVLGKTPLTPRCSTLGYTKSKRFFASPLLK